MEQVTVRTLAGQDFALPPALEGLRELAYNLWWTWTPRASSFFSRIEGPVWSRYRNPVPVLAACDATRWEALMADEDFVVDAMRLLDEFHAYMADPQESWIAKSGADGLEGPIAYFCAEFGLHESMQIYSGGLGVLAGDHCKSASDAGLPFIAVGLLYRRGYFRQQIDADGHQEHAQPDLDPRLLPLRRAMGRGGSALELSVELPGRRVQVAVWVAQVGRVPLLLLDTDVPTNDAADRPISHILYVRGREMRLCQELVLGVGGVRALRALGVQPGVWHLNEGHSAFLLLERASELIGAGRPAEEALREIGRNSVFTIHTPVPAGNEVFARDLVAKYVGGWSQRAGLPLDRLLELGRGITDAADAPFDMTAFVLRHASGANAVSQLHASTATATWLPISGRDIEPITNGVHVPTWIGRPMRRLFERALGRPLTEDLPDGLDLPRLDAIADQELWAAHQQQKAELIAFMESRMSRQFARHGESPDTLRELRGILHPQALTIGFARRFATYKRADLLFTDEQRLARILAQVSRPVQIVFAGKAHPADRPGQQVIQRIFTMSRSPGFRGRIFILEDYDLRVARFLVAGVDLWLNTPRRPMEASGTSGMKAAINGVPSLSVLDGWWDEGFAGDNGWAIGGRESSSDDGAAAAADADALYRLLEEEIIPRFYARPPGQLSGDWLQIMRAAIRRAFWQFSTARMLHEYVERLYLPAARGLELTGSRPAPAA